MSVREKLERERAWRVERRERLGVLIEAGRRLDESGDYEYLSGVVAGLDFALLTLRESA